MMKECEVRWLQAPKCRSKAAPHHNISTFPEELKAKLGSAEMIPLFLSFMFWMVASSVGFSVSRSSLLSATLSDKPKLIYFDAKGAGEMSRILLNIGGIPFEDVR